jgi:hypothetical protein
MFSLEPKPWVMHVTTKPLITSLPPSTQVLSKIIHQTYNDFVMVCQDSLYLTLIINECSVLLFSWDLPSLLVTTQQKQCQAFFSAGKTDEALEAHKYMMDAIDKSVKASCLNWSNGKFSVTSPMAIILTCISFRIQGTM